jgi:hypothetical protein
MKRKHSAETEEVRPSSQSRTDMDDQPAAHRGEGATETHMSRMSGRVLLAWLFVGAPLLWGVLQTLKKAWALFQ